MSTKSHLPRSVQGALLATISSLLMSTLVFITKEVSREIPISLLVFTRNLFGLLFLLPVFIKHYEQLRSDRYVFHGIRIILSFVSMQCTYYTYRHLPATLATSLGMTGALFTTVLAIFFLKDRVDSIKWVCILLGYLGALFIIQPTSVTLEMGILTALLSNFFAGCSVIMAKILSRKDSTLTTVAYTSLGLTFISGCHSYPDWQTIGGRDTLLLAVGGIVGASGHYLYFQALEKVNASFLAPFGYTRLLFAFLISFLFFREVPNFYTVLGSTIVIMTTYIITYRDRRQEVRAQQITP